MSKLSASSLPMLILVGLVSAALFSLTFVINYNMSFSSGSWVWTAVLRYFFTIGILIVLLRVLNGRDYLRELFSLFFRHFWFWCIAGSFSCGLFYTGLAFSAEYLRGWVVAATFQLTIVFSPFVLMLLGYRFNLWLLPFSFLVLTGALMVNWQGDVNINNGNFHLLVLLPILVSALAYPLGNQLANSAKNGGLSFVPHIQSPVLNNGFSNVLLLCLGSIPFWIALVVIVQPGLPEQSQYVQTFMVALFAGVLATSLFMYARNATSDSVKVVVVDTTQSTEVLFSLALELMFINPRYPTSVQLIGLLLVVSGLAGFGIPWSRLRGLINLRNRPLKKSLKR
jgi:drug/metabolite transporter (DMT)-like permease